MLFIRYVQLEAHERAIIFQRDEPKRLYGAGRHLIVRFGRQYRLETYSTRNPWISGDGTEVLVKSQVAADQLEVIRLDQEERAIVWLDGQLERALSPGLHALWRGFYEIRVDRFSTSAVALSHRSLREITTSEAFGDELEVLELADLERAMVWVDGRMDRLLGPGLHALWKAPHRLRTEVVEFGDGRLDHPWAELAMGAAGSAKLIERIDVEADHVGLYFRNGRFIDQLKPGAHGIWRQPGRGQVLHADLRSQSLDVSGQEIITADKVSLRLNAVVTFRVAEPLQMLQASDDAEQALYREAQLTLRAVIGTRELDPLLVDKEALGADWQEQLAPRAKALGLELESAGIKDLILPGEMRVLMNRVTEARKAAEANLIARREETAAMRSQANTARILEQSPTLMKLRELEVLEKVAEKSQLQVVLGETGLSDRLTKLI